MVDRIRYDAFEWLFPAIVALAMVALGTLPYLYAYSLEDGHVRFMGRVDRDPHDFNVHRMLVKQAEEGRFFFENRMTSEPLPRRYVNLEWWLEGAPAYWLGLPSEVVFHIGRVLSAFFLTFSVYALCLLCLDTPNQRRFATALVCFGAGLGWLVWLHARLSGFPMTFYEYTLHGITRPLPLDVTGISPFHQALSRPHFTRTVASAAAFGALLLQGERTGKLRWFVLAGVVLAGRFMLRPYELPESYVLLAAFPLLLMLRDGRFAWRRLLPYALTGALAAPQALYYVYIRYAEPLGALLLYDDPPMPVLFEALRLGIPFAAVLVWFTGFRFLRWMRTSTLLLTLWMAVTLGLAYSYPYFPFGKEGMAALQFLPVILATQGPFRALYRWLDGRLRAAPGALGRRRNLVLAALPVAFIAFATVSNVVSVYRVAHAYSDRNDRWYLPRDRYAALQWLEGHAPVSSVVLSLAETGMWTPVVSHCKTVAGSWMFTPDFQRRADAADRFFARAGDDSFKRVLVLRERVDYVLFGPREAKLAAKAGFEPEELPWLRPVFRKGDVRLFAVCRDQGDPGRLCSWAGSSR